MNTVSPTTTSVSYSYYVLFNDHMASNWPKKPKLKFARKLRTKRRPVRTFYTITVENRANFRQSYES